MLGRWECGPRLIVWTSAELPLSFLCLLCAGRPPLEVRVCLLRPRPALPLLSLCAPPSLPLPPQALRPLCTSVSALEALALPNHWVREFFLAQASVCVCGGGCVCVCVCAWGGCRGLG